MLDEPGRHADVTFVDGLTAAFLAALTFPLLMALVSPISAGASFGVSAAIVGELFADASARFPTARAAWVSCILLAGALFAVVLWAATTLAAAFDGGGWNYVSAALVTIVGTRTPAFVALLLAAVTAWALRVGRTGGGAAPWAVQSGRTGFLADTRKAASTWGQFWSG